MGDNEGEVVVAARCIFLSATAGFKKPVFLNPTRWFVGVLLGWVFCFFMRVF